MKVKENICYGLRFKNKSNSKETKHTLEELVDLLKIGHIMDRYPKNLSGGEKQRVALARALIVKPDVLLLDEPLSALDASIKETIESELKKIHQVLKPTTIMVTHDFREAYHLATRVGVIKNGVIMQTGTVSDIFEKPSSLSVAKFVGMKNIIPLSFIKENYPNTKENINRPDLNEDFFGVRPEKIKIGCLIQEKDFVMSGTIEKIKNAGIYLQLEISYDNYLFQVVVTPNHCDGLTLFEGLAINFGFNFNDICLFS
jgi:ABC-type sulfate/molybdate transport systems ATPase subunit